jgi:3-methylcrotonyl-CoA carboxylase beta subunit
MFTAVARIPTRVSPSSPEFQERAGRARQAAGELARRLARVREMGPDEARARHTTRGKLLVRERIAALCDPGAPFLELSPLAAWGQYDDDVPSAGVVTGIGTIHGRHCVLIANDATVKGGTFYPVSVKKNLRAQRVARENRLPAIYLVDSGGAFLPLQAEIFPDRDHGGRVFYNQAVMSREGTPQIAVVMGSCTAGGAYTPAMSEQVVIVRGSGTIFLAGPPLVRAATGEVVSAEELGGADVHARTSGVADVIADDDRQAMALVREMVRDLGQAPARAWTRDAEEPPACDPEEIYGLVPTGPGDAFDAREALARLLDASDLDEFKPAYGPALVTGFGRLRGWLVGVVAAQDALDVRAAIKGAHFVDMAGARRIPLVFVQAGLTGQRGDPGEERIGRAREEAKLVRAVACASVPMLTVVAGAACGPGTFGLASRAFDPRFLWLLPGARIAAVGPDQAEETMTAGAPADGGDPDRRRAARALWEAQSDPYYSSSRVWDDGILDPLSLRDTLALALDVCSRAPVPARAAAGVIRM